MVPKGRQAPTNSTPRQPPWPRPKHHQIQIGSGSRAPSRSRRGGSTTGRCPALHPAVGPSHRRSSAAPTPLPEELAPPPGERERRARERPRRRRHCQGFARLCPSAAARGEGGWRGPAAEGARVPPSRLREGRGGRGGRETTRVWQQAWVPYLHFND